MECTKTKEQAEEQTNNLLKLADEEFANQLARDAEDFFSDAMFHAFRLAWGNQKLVNPLVGKSNNMHFVE